MALSDEPDLQWRESGAARGRAARPCRKRSATSAFYASGDAAWEVIKDERAARTLAANADRDAANAARDASWALGTWREFARQAAAFDYVDAWDAPAACADDDEARVVRQWASEDVEAFGRDADGAPPQRGPLRVWGREVGDAGQRVYVAAHWARFLKAYADAGDKHYYELIREGARPRAYFDLEFGVLENPGLDGAALTEKWLERFGSAVEAEFFEATPLFADHARCAAEEGLYLACPDLDAQLRGNLAEEPGAAALEALQAAVEAAAGEVSADGVAAALRLKVVSHVLALARRRAAGEAFLVVDWRKQVVQLDATTARKFSRHAIWTLPDGAVFADAAALGRLVKRVARQDLAFDVRDRGTGACFVDCAVYTRNRLFRLARSTKRGKHAPLLLVDTNARLATAKDLLPEASLVVPLWEPSPPPRVLGAVDDTAADGAETARGGDGRPPRSVAPCDSELGAPRRDVLSQGRLPTPFGAALDDAVLALRPGCAVRKWERVTGAVSREGVVRYHLAGNRFCENVGREHKSNNVVINVDVSSSTWFQTCHDSACAGFRGPLRPLPESAAQAIFDLLACEAAADAERRCLG